jgi:DNA-binding transcriptional MerR regulator
MQEPHWTLDELAERVETALAVDYHGQASGRVRAVPDRRAIRWYTTIGLIDRPVAHRGRTALYGPRHLMQLVAVKRLQARGLPLVSIQQELAGATDTQLARVARLPAGVAAEAVHGPAAAATRSDTRADPPPAAARPEALAPPPATAARPPGAAARSAGVAPWPAAGKARRARFWREQPAAFTADSTDPRHDPAGTARAATLQGVRLGDGATLLLEPGRELGREDVQSILDAARPLLATLRDRGLGGEAPNPSQGPGEDLGRDPEPRPAGGTEPRREHP